MYKEVVDGLKLNTKWDFSRVRIDPTADDPTLRTFDNCFAILGLPERADQSTPDTVKERRKSLRTALTDLKVGREHLRPVCDELSNKASKAAERLATVDSCKTHLSELYAIRLGSLKSFATDYLGNVRDRAVAEPILCERATRIGLEDEFRKKAVSEVLEICFATKDDSRRPTPEPKPSEKGRKSRPPKEPKPPKRPKPPKTKSPRRVEKGLQVAKGKVGVMGWALSALPVAVSTGITAALLVLARGEIRAFEPPEMVREWAVRAASGIDVAKAAAPIVVNKRGTAGEAATPRYVGTPVDFKGQAASATFSADGTMLLICGKDDGFVVADGKTGRPLASGKLGLPTPAVRAMPVGDFQSPYFVARSVARYTLIDPTAPDRAAPDSIPDEPDPIGPRRWFEKTHTEGFPPEWAETAPDWIAEIAAIGHEVGKRVLTASVRPGGAWAAVGIEGDGVRLYRRDWGGKPLVDRALHSLGFRPEVVEFSADGKRLLTAGTVAGGARIRVWDTATWTVIGGFDLPKTEQAGVESLSPDGTRLLVRGPDGGLRIWDMSKLPPAAGLNEGDR